MEPPAETASKWEIAFRALAARSPEVWARRQRQAIVSTIVGTVLLLALTFWIIESGRSGIGLSVALATFVASGLGWYRFMGILRGAAESRIRDGPAS